ncbi:MAG: type II toxin-antitoxin system HicB family antitoxin [Terriglobia bacterium]
MQFMVIVERGKSSYGAYVPDLPGCVAVARTRKEVLKLIREAVELHLESIRDEGLDIPEPGSTIEYVHV